MSSVYLVVWISLGPPLPTRPLSQYTSLLHFHTKRKQTKQAKHQHKAAITAWAHNRLGISRHAPTKFTSRLCRRCLFDCTLPCDLAVKQFTNSQTSKSSVPEGLNLSSQILDNHLVLRQILSFGNCIENVSGDSRRICLWKDSVIPVELLDRNLRRE